MSNGNGQTVSLSARIPNPADIGGLLGQFGEQLGRLEIPGLPTNGIGQLSSGFNISLPDTSSWSNIAIPNAASLLQGFPNPADLAGPLTAPLARVRSFMETDVRGELTRIQTALGAIGPPSTANPQAFFEDLFKPLAALSDGLKNSEILQLIVSLGQLLGANEIGRVPEEMSNLVLRLKTLLRERVGNTVLGIGAVSSAGTLVTRLEAQVHEAASWFVLADTDARFRALIDVYGTGPGSLAAQISAMNVGDAASVDGVRGRLRIANEAFAAYTSGLARDLAFSEASLVLINATDMAPAVSAIEQTLATLDTQVIETFGNSIRSLLDRIKNALVLGDELNLDQFHREIQSGLSRAKEELDRLDVSGLVQVMQNFTNTVTEPFHRIEEFKVEVENLVRSGLQTVADAVRQIDLSPIRGAFDQGLAQVEGRLNDLEGIFTTVRQDIETALNQVKTALEESKNFILDPEDGLKKRVEEVFQTLFDLLDQLNIQGVVDQINGVLQPITVELGRIEFTPVIDTTVSVIDTIVDVLGTVAPLLVTDDLKQKLHEATAFLRQIDFGEIATALNTTFDEILSAVDEDALGRFKEEYNKVVAAVNELDPAPLLESIQTEVFDPLIAELERFDPTQLLAPVQEAFNTARDALNGFDPAATLSFVTEFFDNVMAQVNELSPTRLLAPVEEALAEVRQTIMSTLRIDDILTFLDLGIGPFRELLENIDIAAFFNAVGPGMAEVRQAVNDLDVSALIAPLSGVLEKLFTAVGLDVARDGVRALFELVSAASSGLSARVTALPRVLEDKAAELGRLDLNSTLQTLRAKHQEVRAALSVHAAAGPISLELTADVGLLDPMLTLSPITGRVSRVQAAFTERAAALTGLAGSISQPLNTVDTTAQALTKLLSPMALIEEMLREPVRRLMPGRGDGSFKDVLLALLDLLDPMRWRAEIQELANALHGKAKALFGDLLIEPAREMLLTLKRTVDLLDISALREAIEGVFHEVEATLNQFDPHPVIQAMNDTYRRILDLFEQLNPAQFIEEIGQLYRDDVIGVLRAISPRELLLPSLRELFTRIGDLLVAFDIELIFRPILDRLRELKAQLVEGLQRADVSFDRMISTLDSAGGASVSASVSVG
ncbi:MAG TPA: hypothetical protein VGJ37_13525 [Pyrinomonadaceae bacterium]|jgi:hypothetical protein